LIVWPCEHSHGLGQESSLGCLFFNMILNTKEYFRMFLIFLVYDQGYME
jgi:hypothetical protein